MAHTEVRKSRVLVAAAGLFLCLLTLWARLVWLQIVCHERFEARAERNQEQRVLLPPVRGELLDRRTTRAELAPQASKLGLKPADPRQVVALPAEFLAADAPADGSIDQASLLGLAERASRVLVPEATARVRGGN